MISVQAPELVALLTRIAVALERQADVLEAGTYGPAVEALPPMPEFVPFPQVPATQPPAEGTAPIHEPAPTPVPSGTPPPPVDIFAAARATAAANAGHPWQNGPIPAPPAAGPNPDFSAPAPSADKKPWDK